MPTTRLADRSIITVTGEDAVPLMQGLVTADIESLGANEARTGALLSPQGKILCDFLISRVPDGLRIEPARAAAQDLLRRLMMFRLRAKAEIVLDLEAPVAVSWQEGPSRPGPDAQTFLDSRFPEALAVMRHYGEPSPAADAGIADWTQLRIAHGIAEAGSDFAFADAFPHDVNLDQTGGVSFTKGCFVGQEVVSRMQHRGTARRRVLIARGDGDLPSPGAAILSGGREIGTLGSTGGAEGLSLVRIDRAKAAMDAGEPLVADGVRLTLEIPQGARFTWPERTAGAADES